MKNPYRQPRQLHETPDNVDLRRRQAIAYDKGYHSRDEIVDALVDACEVAFQWGCDEWLYQTGQFCRPASNYPPQGTVYGGNHMETLRDALAKAKGE